MHVDLRSDTVTRPTPDMRRAMANAEVGDDGFRDDPTVIRLQERAAGLLGKEAALLLPSGTMGNLCAVLAHTQWGEEVIVEARSHMRVYERGGWSMLGGRVSRQIIGAGGVLDPVDVEAAIAPDDVHIAPTGLVCAENTHMLAGGAPIPPGNLEALAGIAHGRGIPLHLDGARLFNAAIALGLPAAELARPVDSVQICLSKGLGCPIGSLLVGNRDFIARAHRMRQPLGGVMRQAGIIAAAGLVAFDAAIDRLAVDHQHARRLAVGLANIGRGLTVDLAAVQTNLVYVSTAGVRQGANWFLARLAEADIHALALDPGTVRMVTHRDISREAIDYTLQTAARILAGD
jgi:threonine aldolase